MIRLAVSLWAGYLFFSANPASADVLKNGVYQFRADAVTSTGIEFSQDEIVAVQVSQDGQTMIHFQPAAVEVGMLNPNVKITKEEAARLPMEYVGANGARAFDFYLSPLKSTGRARFHYMGATGCVAYVLRAIGWQGGRSGNGWEVTRTLRSMGWHSVSCSNPAPGTVASWSGGHAGSGHTAIWQGCWAYDLACADPGHNYHMLDCVAR